MGIGNRTVSVKLAADVRDYVTNVGGNAVKATRDLNTELGALGKQHKDKFNQLNLAASTLGLGLTAAFGAIVKSAADFDKEMSAVASVTDTSGKALDSLRTAAINAGRDTAYSATEAAKAEEELGKAGLSTADILGGGLKGALGLAAASGEGLADAATDITVALGQFQLKGNAASHVSDLLAAGANKSEADVHGLSLALSQSGMAAHQLGMSLDDTVGTLAAFAHGGLKGSDAGTSLKTMLLALENPTQQSAALMRQYGISLYDAGGKFVGITKLAGQLQGQLGGLSEAQRNAAMAQIFGNDAVRAANVLYQNGAKGLQAWITSVNEQGAAADAAAKRMDNLSGDVEQLRGSLETLAIQSGSGVNSALRGLTQVATGAVNEFGQLPGPIQATGTMLLGVSGGSLLAASGLLKVRQTAQEALTALREMGPAGEKAAGALGFVGKGAGTAVLAGTLGLVGFEAIRAGMDWINRNNKITARSVNDLTQALQRFASEGKVTGEMSKIVGKDLNAWAKNFATIANEQFWAQTTRNADALKRLDKPVRQLAADQKDLDKSLSDLVQNGNATAAKVAFDQIAGALTAQGYSMADVNSMFSQYTTAAGNVASSNTALAQGFLNTDQATTLMSKGLQDAVDHGQSLADVFKALHGAALDFLGGDIAVKQDLADLTKQWQRGKDAINDNTQAGRDNLKMVAQTITDAQQAMQAKYNETGSVQAATDTYNGYIASLKAALRAQKLSDDQINQLIDTYAKMPPLVATPVTAPGLPNTINQAQALLDALERINRTWKYKVVGNYIQTPYGKLPQAKGGILGPGGVQRFADGGVAGVYPPSGPGLIQFAEEVTRGETLIPNYGIPQARGLALSDYAASHYGGHVVAGNRGGWGSTPNISVTVSAAPGGGDFDRFMSNWFLESVRGGRIQLSVLPSGRVGQATR
jgi:TP901 family phage tail tape measure protein